MPTSDLADGDDRKLDAASFLASEIISKIEIAKQKLENFGQRIKRSKLDRLKALETRVMNKSAVEALKENISELPHFFKN